jgi:predicted transcriptional regulator
MQDYTLNMKLPSELADKLKEVAKSKNISLSSLIRLTLTDFVNNNK